MIDGGQPFAEKVKNSTGDGKVSTGSVGTPASGYSIIQANSLDEAVELAKRCPVLLGGAQISVYETFPVM